MCVCSDTICDLGGGTELANYGEYSGAPSESQTFEYAKTVLSLMTKEKRPDGTITELHTHTVLAYIIHSNSVPFQYDVYSMFHVC